MHNLFQGGLACSGEDGICGSGEEYGVSGDGGGVGKARSLSTFASDRNGTEDDVLPAEEQPLLAAASPTARSPGYVTESDLEEDPEEGDEDPEEDPADYPTDRDDDDDEEESSGDDADDEEEEEDEDEEEEHPTLADSIPPPLVHRTTARISIPAQAPVPFLSGYLQMAISR
nr:hypothetical protein [Tanacetum cinerariifolium]